MSLCAWGRVFVISLLIVFSSFVSADSLSFTGNLSSPSSPVIQPFTVSTAGTITIQTWGFGGGTNAAGTLITPGGIDPLVAIFSGIGPGASIFNIGGDPNNPAGTSDTLTNFSSFAGCPPAGMVMIGAGAGSSVCGDIRMVLSLSVGTYTLVVGDADYQPNALIDPASTGILGDGFTDFTGGVFETCNTNNAGNTTCVTRSSQYAVDISGPGIVTPEPGTLVLLGTGVIACLRKLKR